MNSNMVKPEKFGHLHIAYHFTVPLREYSRIKEIKNPPDAVEYTL